jgi:hypothetical protein
MAKAKSGSGSKTTRNNKQETNTNNPVVTPGVESPTPEMTAAAKNVVASKPPETKIAEPRAEAKPAPPVAPAKPETNNRIFGLKKPEARQNVFPINVEEEIRRRAYELYEQRGPSGGNEAGDWLAAEREVMQRYHQHSA